MPEILNPSQFPRNRWQPTRGFDVVGIQREDDYGKTNLRQVAEPKDPREPNAVGYHYEREEQPRIIPLHQFPEATPEQQTQSEFSHDSRTWFHGSRRNTMPRKTQVRTPMVEGPSIYSNKGFHVGTAAAARDRMEDDRASRARIFTGRIKRPLDEETSDEGEGWDVPPRTAQPYKNEYEDEGSTSVVLGSPSDFETHRQAVTRALHAGRPVRRATRFEYDRTGGEKGPQYDPNIKWNLEAAHQQKYGYSYADNAFTDAYTHRDPNEKRSKPPSPRLPGMSPKTGGFDPSATTDPDLSDWQRAHPYPNGAPGL